MPQSQTPSQRKGKQGEPKLTSMNNESKRDSAVRQMWHVLHFNRRMTYVKKPLHSVQAQKIEEKALAGKLRSSLLKCKFTEFTLKPSVTIGRVCEQPADSRERCSFLYPARHWDAGSFWDPHCGCHCLHGHVGRIQRSPHMQSMMPYNELFQIFKD